MPVLSTTPACLGDLTMDVEFVAVVAAMDLKLARMGRWAALDQEVYETDLDQGIVLRMYRPILASDPRGLFGRQIQSQDRWFATGMCSRCGNKMIDTIEVRNPGEVPTRHAYLATTLCGSCSGGNVLSIVDSKSMGVRPDELTSNEVGALGPQELKNMQSVARILRRQLAEAQAS